MDPTVCPMTTTTTTTTTTQFVYRKDLGICDALFFVSYTLESALESGKKARIVQIDFRAAFDWVNHQGILYKPCSVGIGGSALSMFTLYLSNRSQHVMVDSCQSYGGYKLSYTTGSLYAWSSCM